MKLVLKPLNEQVIIITGASGEIGLMTARMAAQKGAKIVAAAKDEEVLLKLSDEINDRGGIAVFVQADMGIEEDVLRVAVTSMRVFGTFDTWVNITTEPSFAGDDYLIENMKQMFKTQFWGIVYGSRLAANHLKDRDVPGAIINVDGFFREQPKPQQSVFSATKHAVQSWTEELRVELEKEKIPGSVSFIHPRGTATYHNDSEVVNGTSGYQGNIHAREVAEAILYCAEHPKREMHIGSRSSVSTVLRSVSPLLMDKIKDVAKAAWPRSEPGNHPLDEPQKRTNGRGSKGLITRGYEKASKHPLISAIALAGLGASLWMWAKRKYKAIENS